MSHDADNSVHVIWTNPRRGSARNVRVRDTKGDLARFA
jgi:hypothetical protein